MTDKNFKKIGKLQFSIDNIPIDSDLMLAIKLATEKRDRTLDELVEILKKGALNEDKDKIVDRFDFILGQNESIKLMEDAMIAVRLYKLSIGENKNTE